MTAICLYLGVTTVIWVGLTTTNKKKYKKITVLIRLLNIVLHFASSILHIVDCLFIVSVYEALVIFCNADFASYNDCFFFRSKTFVRCDNRETDCLLHPYQLQMMATALNCLFDNIHWCTLVRCGLQSVCALTPATAIDNTCWLPVTAHTNMYSDVSHTIWISLRYSDEQRIHHDDADASQMYWWVKVCLFIHLVVFFLVVFFLFNKQMPRRNNNDG